MADREVWVRCEKEHEGFRVCPVCFSSRKNHPGLVRVPGALLIEDRDTAIQQGAEAICPPRHRFTDPKKGHPCETCLAKAGMVLAAALNEGER